MDSINGTLALPQVKQCRICGEVKPRREYRESSDWGWKHAKNCLSCLKKKSSEYHRKFLDRNEKNRTRAQESWHASSLRRHYGLTTVQYDAAKELQGGVCAICGNKNGKDGKRARRLAVDHDHKTGCFRALLCDNCNILIGLAEESEIILERAADYLEQKAVRNG
jgi:hypothetical protein